MEAEYWRYYPRVFDNDIFFPPLLQELSDKCASYTSIERDDKKYAARRISCFFADRKAKVGTESTSSSQTNSSELRLPMAGQANFSYTTLPGYHWDDSPLVSQIKGYLETHFNTKFNYCLAHVYRTGEDSISWHSDREALNTLVVSVSLGHVRKFRLRPMSATSGYQTEYELGLGDILAMWPGCQQKYKHCVPQQLAIKQPRINLTFRQIVT